MSESHSEAGKTRTPPYVSYRTLKTLVQDLHEHGIPSRIDRSVLTRFSGVVGTQLMTALRFLELVDTGNHPTERLRGLVASHGKPDWNSELEAIVRDAYAPLFDIDLETATPSHFSETFRKAFPGSDAVLQKCATFFLYAARDAGINVSDRVLKGRKPRPLIRKRPVKADTGGKKESGEQSSQQENPPPPPPPPPATKRVSEVLLENFNPNEMDETQQAAVWTLLRYFKAREIQ